MQALGELAARLERERLANGCMSADKTRRLDRSLEKQICKRGKRVTPEMVDAFAGLVRERLRCDDPVLCKAYIALFVSKVAIYQQQTRIAGSTAMLETAVGKTEPGLTGMVPSFDREWCRLQDSNL